MDAFYYMIKRNTPFELVLSSLSITLLLVRFIKPGSSLIFVAIAYALTGVLILSKTLRLKNTTSKLKTIWLLCVVAALVSAVGVLLMGNLGWSYLWLAGLLVFSFSSQKAFNRKAQEDKPL